MGERERRVAMVSQTMPAALISARLDVIEACKSRVQTELILR